jgi:hypothetical protein
MSRTLRRWTRRLAAQWGQLSGAMRISLGLAIVVLLAVYVVRYRVRPLQQERTTVEKRLQAEEVPAYVPTPEGDNELQETLLKIENTSDTLERQRSIVAASLEPGLLPSPNEESAVVAEFDTLLYENGISLMSRTHVSREEVAGVLIASEYAYAVTGRFDQIDAWLQAVTGFEHLCSVRQFGVATFDIQDGKEGSESRGPRRRGAPLKADFLLKLYFMEEGAL